MQYDIHKLDVEQLAEEIQTVLEEHEGWMTLRDIVEALDIEDQSDAKKLVRSALEWMFDRSMLHRSVYGWDRDGRLYKAL